jgi:hypothetical protein
MISGKTYAEKLKDPRWQKKRLEIFERDKWTCQACGDTTQTLNVHHRFYKSGLDPWEYNEVDLVTLCDNCHGIERDQRAEWEQSLLLELRYSCFVGDLEKICFALCAKGTLEYLYKAGTEIMPKGGE